MISLTVVQACQIQVRVVTWTQAGMSEALPQEIRVHCLCNEVAETGTIYHKHRFITAAPSRKQLQRE